MIELEEVVEIAWTSCALHDVGALNAVVYMFSHFKTSFHIYLQAKL